jgi:riboflavin-specific deaminase-like protein
MDFLKSLPAIAAEHRRKTGRPFVTLSYAQSLDGCIAARRGQALSLSGPQSMIFTHKLRAGNDAILVGIGTVLSDNPRLNVRLVNGNSPRPIVLDSQVRIPPDSKLLHQNTLTPWVIATREPEPERRKAVETSGAEILTIPGNFRGQVDLGAMLDKLGELGINSLMVEGGARIITNFLLERLTNFMVLTVAPIVIFGGLRGVNDLGCSDPVDLPKLQNPQHKWLGKDLILWGNLT